MTITLLTVIVATITSATWKAIQNNALFVKVSEGNKKLVPNKNTKFLIWNLPPIKTCPFATKLCKKFCYAMKAYKAYPSAKAKWNYNLKLSQGDDFVDRMVFTILAYANRPSYKNAKSIVFRIHESGDFYNNDYTNKWLEIASIIESIEPKVTFMAYTKSVEYFVNKDIPSNMTVRYSLWDDTDEEQYNIAKALQLPIYTAVDKFTTETKKERCECVDCGACHKCWCKSIKTLKCEMH